MRVRDIHPEGRRTGSTSRQMLEAPERAVYVWPVPNTNYARHLAMQLGRADLKIVGPSIFENDGNRLRGIRTEVVIDHACLLSADESRILDELTKFKPKP